MTTHGGAAQPHGAAAGCGNGRGNGVAVVNGTALLQCPVAAKENVGDVMRVPLDVVQTGSIQVVFYSPSIVAKAGRSWAGTLVVNGQPYPLGTISSRQQKVAAEVPLPGIETCGAGYDGFTPVLALQLAIEEQMEAICGDKLAERIGECAVGVLEDAGLNPRQGSLELSHVAEVVKDREPDLCALLGLEADPEALVRLLANHASFTIFSYSEREVQERNLGEVTAGEARIVLKQRSALQFTSDEEEQRLVQYLAGLLGDGDLTADDVLQRMHKDNQHTGLAFPVCPGFSFLMRFLRRNTDLFSWSADPNKVTMVSLRTEESPAPPLERQASSSRSLPNSKRGRNQGKKNAARTEAV
eukprot:TRINITY_DN898_c3_g1_i1.p2 TRINITY_DN898_c3_g1~~TRINITY_DN898_c3_g1_i1.p2  ORF type:complete len:356 (+),score=135.36 TRINITY_DN898_c3_g1_i1:49-1116(+)